jgi:hypothetical protein
LSKFVLIPAIITEDGLIDFYSYQDIKNNLQLDDASTKEEIIKNIVLADLYKRFKMSDQGLAGLEELQKNVVYDSAINQAPLERIKRIKDLIKNDGDFTSLATKYGDESGELSISSDKASTYDFYNDVKQLELGEVSNVIYTAEGYYIFKNSSQDSVSLNLSYVFVRAKKIDDYLKETVKNYRYFSLVK